MQRGILNKQYWYKEMNIRNASDRLLIITLFVNNAVNSARLEACLPSFRVTRVQIYPEAK